MSQIAYFTFAEDSAYITNHATGDYAVSGWGVYPSSFTPYDFYHMQGNGYPYSGEYGSNAGDPGQGYSGAQAICTRVAGHNLGAVTFVAGFYYRGVNGDGHAAYLFDKAMGAFTIKISVYGSIQVYRLASNGAALYWDSPASTISPGANIYLEISWYCPSPSNYTTPHVHVWTGSGSAQHINMGSPVNTGVSGSWYDDSVAPYWWMCNYGTNQGCGSGIGGSYALRGNLYNVRLFDEARAIDAVTNHDTDAASWGAGGGGGGPTVPSAVSISSSNASPSTGVSFTLSGWLTYNSGQNGIGGRTVILYRNSAQWTTVTTNSGGYWYYSTSEANAGTYTYSAYFAGDSSYQVAAITSTYVTVSSSSGGATNLTNSTSNASPTTGQTFTLSGYLTSGGVGLVGKTISLSKGGTHIASLTTGSGGYWYYSTSEATAGSYTYDAWFGGDGSYTASASAYATVTVGSPPAQTSTSLSIYPSNYNPAVGAAFTLSGYLTNSNTGAGIVSKSIALTRNGASMGSVTTTTGGAWSTSTSEGTSGTYNYGASFAGDGSYYASSGTTSVTVGTVTSQVATSITLNTSNYTPDEDQDFILSGNLTVTSTGAGLAGKTVTLYRDTTYVTTLTTTTNGLFTDVNYEASSATYTYYVYFAGDSSYYSSQASRQVSVVSSNKIANATTAAMQFAPIQPNVQIVGFTTCRVQYDAFSTSTITNGGLDGATQNGVSVGTYGTLDSGATYIDLSSASDYIKIPQSSGHINDLTSVAFEFCIEMINFTGSSNRFYSKGPFEVYLDPVNRKLVLSRTTANGPDIWTSDACFGTATAAAHEANAVIKYTTWPQSPNTTVTNQGTGGATYNGTESANHYTTTPMGYSAQQFTTIYDGVTIPYGFVGVGGNVTVEYGFKYATTSQMSTLWVKAASYYTQLICSYVPSTHTFQLKRGTGADTSASQYSASYTLVDGTWYDVQVTWSSTFPSAPILRINDQNITLTVDSNPTGSWADNGGAAFGSGYNYVANYGLLSTVAFFRWHNVVLPTSDLTDNYNVDKARWESVPPPSSETLNYEVQLSWNPGSGPASADTPLLKVNDAVVSMHHTTVGSGAWLSDASYDAYIGNTSALTNNLNAKLTLFRLYNGAVPTDVFSSDYAIDMLRFGLAAFPTAPNMEFAAIQPTVNTGIDDVAQPLAADMEFALMPGSDCTIQGPDYVNPTYDSIEFATIEPTAPISVQTITPPVIGMEFATTWLQCQISETATPDCATIEVESVAPTVIEDSPNIIDLEGTMIRSIELDSVLTDAIEMDAELIDLIELEALEEYE